MEFEAPDWRLPHSSLSRRRRFAFCPVGYYLYHVPGRDGYGAYPADWHYKLYCAKHRTHRLSWVRSLFRQAVREYFQSGDNLRKRKLENFIRSRFEREFALLVRQAYKSDPKLVAAVIELEEKIITEEYFYDSVLYELNNLCWHFQQSAVWRDLISRSALDFNFDRSVFRWQLGGINFVNEPDLLWSRGGKLCVLDMNSFDYPQEQTRAVELYCACICRFMRIKPEAVQVYCFDMQRLESIICTADPAADFTETFRQLAGEAAMWRDYLLKQASSAKDGIWHYARKDNCRNCRFNQLCPARHGTAEPES